MMLAVHEVGMVFGGVVALDGVSLTVKDSAVMGVIGPNGSGKSTLINVMTGFYRPTHGTVTLNGQVLSGESPEAIRRLGVARTFQNLRLVQEMTVLDNAVAGLFLSAIDGRRMASAAISDFFAMPAARRRTRQIRRMAQDSLELVGLKDHIDSRVGDLAYAQQKRLELARAVALRPQVLILDEPTAGMSSDEAEELVDTVVELTRGSDMPMCLFLVEHRLELVLRVSDEVIVMDGGRVLATGTSVEIAKNAEVRRIYVGGE